MTQEDIFEIRDSIIADAQTQLERGEINEQELSDLIQEANDCAQEELDKLP
ncbi:MAG: hypothetical protein ACTSPB_15610 [Candidatus Thorarchaeota archaeon]